MALPKDTHREDGMNECGMSEIIREHLVRIVASSTTRERDQGYYRKRQEKLEGSLDIFIERWTYDG